MTSQIRCVSIVGSGTMGRRIAYQCIIRGFETGLYDVSHEARKGAQQQIQQWVKERIEAGLLKEAESSVTSRLNVFSDLDACLSECDLVIECVPEKLKLKREVFSKIDQAAPAGALIGTNSSSIPGSRLADATGRPGQVFNYNFGPIDDLKVEVMPHPGTAPETLESALAFVRALDMIPIRVEKEILGYACNRVWRAVKREVLFLLAGGHISFEELDRGWMLDWNTPIGPCGLMDLIGLDVVRDIEMVYFEDSGDERDRPPRFLDEMIERGDLGVKSGRGFYQYPAPAFQRSGWLEGDS